MLHSEPVFLLQWLPQEWNYCRLACVSVLNTYRKKIVSRQQQEPDSSMQRTYKNHSTGLTSLCDQTLSTRRFTCISLHFSTSCNTHFICYTLILVIFIIGIYIIHLSEFQDVMVQLLKYNFFVWIDQNAWDESVRKLIKMQKWRNDSWKRVSILWVSTIWIYISKSLSINLKSQHAISGKSKMCFWKLYSITISPKDSWVINEFWAVVSMQNPGYWMAQGSQCLLL